MRPLFQQLVQREAGEGPDGLVGIALPHPLHKGKQGALVVRLKGLAAQKGKAVDIVGGQQAQNIVLRLPGKGLAVAEVPGLGLEAAGAAVGTAGDKEGDPHPLAVGNVAVFNVAVVHGYLSLWTGWAAR